MLSKICFLRILKQAREIYSTDKFSSELSTLVLKGSELKNKIVYQKKRIVGINSLLDFEYTKTQKCEYWISKSFMK
jgi:hypothetical protein